MRFFDFSLAVSLIHEMWGFFWDFFVILYYSGCKNKDIWGRSFVRPAVGLRQNLSFKYSGSKRNQMWGKSLLRPAAKLWQILRFLSLSLSLDNFINTAGVRRMECGAKACLDPLWDLDKFWQAVGLSQIFEINFINTAGLRGIKCGAKACLDPLSIF